MEMDQKIQIFNIVNMVFLHFAFVFFLPFKKRLWLYPLSPLLYSVMIDTFDWFFWNETQNYFYYVWQGIIWNLKSSVCLFVLCYMILLIIRIFRNSRKVGYENKISRCR